MTFNVRMSFGAVMEGGRGGGINHIKSSIIHVHVNSRGSCKLADCHILPLVMMT